MSYHQAPGTIKFLLPDEVPRFYVGLTADQWECFLALFSTGNLIDETVFHRTRSKTLRGLEI
jgi:hypothetical protein